MWKQLPTASKVCAILAALCIISAVSSIATGNFFVIGTPVFSALVCAGLCWFFYNKKIKFTNVPNNRNVNVPAYSYNDVDFYVFDTVDISKLKKGLQIELRPEPENEHDNKAVAVYCNGIQLGYLYRNNLQRMYHDFYAEDGYVTAELSMISPKIQLKMCYYK